MAEKKTKAAPTKAVTAVKKDDTKPGFFHRIGKWFREMKSELKKVILPTRQQLTKNSLISVGVMVVAAWRWVGENERWAADVREYFRMFPGGRG